MGEFTGLDAEFFKSGYHFSIGGGPGKRGTGIGRGAFRPAFGIIATHGEIFLGATIVRFERVVGDGPVGAFFGAGEDLEVFRLKAEAPAAPVDGGAAVHGNTAIVEAPFGLAHGLVFALLVVTVVVGAAVTDEVVPPGSAILRGDFGTSVEDQNGGEAIALQDGFGDGGGGYSGADEDVIKFADLHAVCPSAERARGLRL